MEVRSFPTDEGSLLSDCLSLGVITDAWNNELVFENVCIHLCMLDCVLNINGCLKLADDHISFEFLYIYALKMTLNFKSFGWRTFD